MFYDDKKIIEKEFEREKKSVIEIGPEITKIYFGLGRTQKEGKISEITSIIDSSNNSFHFNQPFSLFQLL